MMDTNEELKQLLRASNEFNPSLHFTCTYSKISIDFLDLTIYKGTQPYHTPLLWTQKHTRNP